MILAPDNDTQALQAVADAVAQQATLEIVGHGSRRPLGHPVQADAVLDLSRLTGVVVYEPEELILTVRAGTPLAEVEALLAARGQQLAFEPPDFGPLWGERAGLGTIGGMLATGLGGSRRFQAGAPRDHLLGFKAINGFGEAFAAGGRVVKNVTGFDLPKLMAGSYGALGAMTEVTLKVLPAPTDSRTLWYLGLDEKDGLTLLRTALAGSVPVTGAAYVGGATVLRLEGPPAVIDAQIASLGERLGRPGEVIEAVVSRPLWRRIGGGHDLARSNLPVWRISVPPASAAKAAKAIRSVGAEALAFDWGGGLIWAACAADLRPALAGASPDAHALVVRGGGDGLAVFPPQSPGVARLSERVRAQFDPLGIFNPGRMGGASA
jgi:glycolate oxidase FAD binding subunit